HAMMPLTIGPPRDAERMPVWKWGHIGYDADELRFWKQMGFTGGTIGNSKQPAPHFSTPTSHMKMLDEGVRLDMELGFSLAPPWANDLSERDELRGTFSCGARPKTLQPLAPAVIEYPRHVADSWTRELAEFHGLRFLFLNTEYETSLAPHPETVRLAKAEAGVDVATLPIEEGSRLRGRLDVNPAEFSDGIIDDDHPHYRFLKWWWERGHGTAAVNAAMSDAAKKYCPD